MAIDLAQGTELARSANAAATSAATATPTGPPPATTAFEEAHQTLDLIFKALADSTRREILCLLNERQLAVNQIVDHFHLTQPSISRHLAILKAAGLVLHERDGQRVIYRLGEPELISVATHFLGALALPVGPQRG